MTIRFVVGLPPANYPGTMRILQWESQRFNDLQILNQSENMNEGKTFEYFSYLARKWPVDDPSKRPWDYAMKADDDSLINIPQLLEKLRPMVPRTSLYMVLHR